MAFNKSKALENALKLLNQGKTAQAINEYQQILRHDGKDQATLMTVGDLFARQGDMKQAVEYFERLAQVYLNDGFNSKAIAIYKKIAKLAPAELAPLERLADLYVQQGVLSEARPLFLQIAEAHLKANRAQKAVEVLHRLLDVEPENPRVQMRLAELYNVMGQKKEAAQTYYNYAQRLHDRGELDEAQKLIERALEVDANNAPALLLRSKVLAGAGKPERAISILENHAEADAGGEVTSLLIDSYLKAGQNELAADRARNQLVRGSSHFGMLLHVADALIEKGETAAALALLGELRDPMIEVNEHDKFLAALTKVTEKMPGSIEPLEMTAEFCRHTSDPFRLSAALSSLVDIYDAEGNKARAEELMLELIDRNKGDERLVARMQKLRGQGGATMEVSKPIEAPAEASVQGTEGTREDAQDAQNSSAQAAPAAPLVPEEPLDEETQKYIAQALTDVDLFSSYGLMQKAGHLLENVLQRAPRHTPTLERLLDMQVAAGHDRRTAEVAATLEAIYRGRGDSASAERFGELRRRFRDSAGLNDDELNAAVAEQLGGVPAQAAAATKAADAHVEPAQAGPAEFEIPLISIEPDAESPVVASATAAATTAPSEEQEIDLSDEWASMVQEDAPAASTESPAAHAENVAGEGQGAAQAASEPAAEEEAEFVLDADELEAELAGIDAVTAAAPETIEAQLHAPEPEASDAEVATEIETPSEAELRTAEPEVPSEPSVEPVIEIVEPVMESPVEEEIPAEAVAAEPVAEAEPVIELIETPEPGGEFELELKPEGRSAGPATTEDFLSDLAAEVEDMEAPAAHVESKEYAAAPQASAAKRAPAAEEVSAESLNELAEVFQEFRSELGEMDEEVEDLETHYNLGIAYREMGLLDEAIGEFQRVAKAIQNGRPFRYQMNCSTLLALSFMDKGEPKIAALWYRRALDTPGLDPETVLALRYDLGVSLETAGESPAALDSFRQVYAMNIDYRDVADRIATLQKV